MKKLFTAAALLMASMNALAVPITCGVVDTSTSYCVDSSYGTYGSIEDQVIADNNIADGDSLLTIAAFDDDGGSRTLTGVSVKVFGAISSGGTITNNLSSLMRATAEIKVEFDEAAIGFVPNQPWSVKTSAGDNAYFGKVLLNEESIDEGNYNLEKDESFTFNLSTGIKTDEIFNINISDFLDDVDFAFFGLARSNFKGFVDGGTADYSTVASTASFGAVEAIYTYETSASPATDVPEPVSILMFGLGLIGLSQTRKAKKCLIG
ncbi:MAG: hypothetical protein ACI8R9_000525 [Paraglaciecola sp.]|jgi:hypothetical protein